MPELMVPDPPPSDPQMIAPVVEVSSVSQPVRLESMSDPPEIVIPFDDESPADDNAPVNTVDVPATVESIFPPVMVMP